MLLLIAVLAILATGFLLHTFVRRQNRSLSAPVVRDLQSTELRPLFLPDEAQLKSEAAAAQAREIARREYSASAERIARVDEALANWRRNRDKATAIAILGVTAADGRDGDFARAANEIIKVFRESGVPGLTSKGLSMVIDSHIRLLPPVERASGAVFWLKEEVARLGSENER
jgi:hypothetical protein